MGDIMVKLHKLNGASFYLNAHHIERIEENPDTTITLTNDRVYLVQEKAVDIIDLMVAYHSRIIPFQKSDTQWVKTVDNKNQ
jgi:flagellar protein FlbD